MSEAWRRPTLAEILNRSYGLGTFFGVRVSIHILTVLVPLILLLRSPFDGVHRIVFAVFMTVALYATIWLHEMGHIVAGWRHAILTRDITLSPLGGVAHMQAPAPHPKADIFISLAGPATHLPAALLFYALKSIDALWSIDVGGVPWLGYAPWFLYQLNLWLMLFNLLPFYPMDGGRVLQAVLSMRMHPQRALLHATSVGLVGGAALALAGLFGFLGGGILIAIGITNALVCWQTRQALARGATMGYEPRQPWEGSGEEWKRGGGVYATFGGSEKKPGYFARRRQRREFARRRKEQEGREALEKEVDRILQKISESGMPSLTRKERTTLEKMSEAQKRSR